MLGQQRRHYMVFNVTVEEEMRAIRQQEIQMARPAQQGDEQQ